MLLGRRNNLHRFVKLRFQDRKVYHLGVLRNLTKLCKDKDTNCKVLVYLTTIFCTYWPNKSTDDRIRYNVFIYDHASQLAKLVLLEKVHLANK